MFLPIIRSATTSVDQNGLSGLAETGDDEDGDEDGDDDDDDDDELSREATRTNSVMPANDQQQYFPYAETRPQAGKIHRHQSRRRSHRFDSPARSGCDSRWGLDTELLGVILGLCSRVDRRTGDGGGGGGDSANKAWKVLKPTLDRFDEPAKIDGPPDGGSAVAMLPPATETNQTKNTFDHW